MTTTALQVRTQEQKIVRYEQGGKEVARHTTPETTKEDHAILLALNAPKASEAPEDFFDEFLPRFINESVLLLGHKNSMGTDEEQILLASEIRKIIRGKWHFYTVEEIKIILRMGIRGEFKAKEDSVVYLNIEQINSWFKKYRTERKPKAMKTTRLVEEQPEVHHEPLAFLAEGLRKINEETITPMDYQMLTSAYYDRFKAAGLLPKRPALEWQKMMEEERQRAMDRGNRDMDMLNDSKRKAFSSFREAIKAGISVPENSYESAAMSACRVRVFKEVLERMAWEDIEVTDLGL